MRGKPASYDSVIARIAAAPFSAEGWGDALAAMADITGGWGGQMIAQSEAGPQFTHFANVAEEGIRDFVVSGAADPARSPRLTAGLRSPRMKPISDQDYISDAAKSKYPIYRDFYHRFDAYYCASARIGSLSGFGIVVALFHDRGAGDFSRGQLDVFEGLLPHVRAAFDVHLAVESEAVNLALGALEDVAQAALVCDIDGRLFAASTAGEAFLAAGDFLSLRLGRLTAADPASAERLAHALRRARAPLADGSTRSSSIVLSDAGGKRWRKATVAPFPRDATLCLGGGILVALADVARPLDPGLLRQVGLSAAEAGVAVAVFAGGSIAEIACRRGVALERVRTQLKSIRAKLGVRDMAQLAVRLRELG